MGGKVAIYKEHKTNDYRTFAVEMLLDGKKLILPITGDYKNTLIPRYIYKEFDKHKDIYAVRNQVVELVNKYELFISLTRDSGLPFLPLPWHHQLDLKSFHYAITDRFVYNLYIEYGITEDGTVETELKLYEAINAAKIAKFDQLSAKT